MQIDVAHPDGDWNTILTLSRVDMGGLQFFNYEQTIQFEENRLQCVSMWPDSTAIYNYILVSEDSTGVVPHIGENGNWYIGSTDTGKPSRGQQGTKGDKGDTGPAYVLTDADKTSIKNAVIAALPVYDGGTV